MSLNRRAVGWAFGQVVRKARKATGLRQQAFAPMAGISWAGLSLIERGLRAPSIAIVFSIAAALEITPGTLVGRAHRLVVKQSSLGLESRDEREKSRF